MKLLPIVLILLSFAAIVIGVIMKILHYPGANFVILCGLVSEVIFIAFNRMMSPRRKDKG